MRGRFVIMAYENGQSLGYIKSVSYKLRKYVLTPHKMDAKTYMTEDLVQGEIDTLTAINMYRVYMYYPV